MVVFTRKFEYKFKYKYKFISISQISYAHDDINGQKIIIDTL